MKNNLLVSLFALIGVLGFGIQPSAAQSDALINYHLDEIVTYTKKVDNWNSASNFFPSVNSNDDYGAFAISKDARATWFSKNSWERNDKLNAALDALKESLYRRIPENKMNPQDLANHNAAEEKMIVAAMSNITGMKVFKTGFKEPNWLVDKNSLGIPTARYKHGLIYGRNEKNEDPFCRIWYVNVIQDYTGSGTYAVARARYISIERVACPAP